MVGNHNKRLAIQVGMVSMDAVHDCWYLTLDITVPRVTHGQFLLTESCRWTEK